MTVHRLFFVASALSLILVSTGTYAADYPTKFTNKNSIGNTRHNLTQKQASGGGPNTSYMDFARNDYAEVCVYCHTPHGANTTVNMPLWNRTVKTTTFTTYAQNNSSTLTQSVTQPGNASLTCLSCHDGLTAVDSIINMPGSGRYDAGSMSNQNDAFLNTWINQSGQNALVHGKLTLALGPGDSCLGCHQVGIGATDFTVFVTGTDLKNDHPVGITYSSNGDFNTPGGVKGTTRYFDKNSNGNMDSSDVRLYDTGNGIEVECASCHDPHGVPSAGPGSTFIPSFLRVSNSSSALCLTCHVK